MENTQATRITVTVNGESRADPHLWPGGGKGIGEIGITGTAAAIGNAVYHATGRRVRDLPIILTKLLSPSVERSYSTQRREE